MNTRVLRRFLVLAAAAALLAAGVPATAENEGQVLRARPVAFYDVDAVLRATGELADERMELTALVERCQAEIAPLQAEVHALRDQLAGSATLPSAQRRALEARLAERTIALLVLRTESLRDVALERERVLDRMQGPVVAAVARIARERDLPVVVRADRGTIVLDEDAVDLTPLVIAALDGPPRDQPDPVAPGERRRTRLQSCEVAAATDTLR